jgi:hypothetical protein
LPEEELPVKTCVTRKVPHFFSFDYWKDFNLFPANRYVGVLTVPKSKIPQCDAEGFLAKPFGGGAPTVIEAALTGSSVGSEDSSVGPSGFAQAFSVLKSLPGLTSLAIPAVTQLLWKLNDRKLDLGVCTQQDDKCGIHDAAFTHGAVIDAASLGMTIGQHHAIDKADKSKTLKIIYTIHTLGNEGSFFQFFNTTTNIGVEPGGYHWPPQAGGQRAASPYRSWRIFDYYLDQELFNSLLVKVPGTFVRTVRLSLTTIANPHLYVESGQKVDMLVMIMSSDLPLTEVPIGKINLDDFGRVARSSAASAELLAIVTNFAST